MERASDTRTKAPIQMYERPWNLDLDVNFGADYGNFNQLTADASATFYQYFERPDIGYYVQGRFSYLASDVDETVLTGGGTVRGDFGMYNFTQNLKLSVAMFATAFHNNILGLDLRTAAGGGLWLNYSSDHIKNGLSVFAVNEYEMFGDNTWEFAPRLSVRNITVVPLGEDCTFTLDAYYTPNVDDFRDFRTSVAGIIDVPLDPRFSLNVTGLYEYDSRPKPGVKPHDFTTTLGLSVSIGAEEAEKAETATPRPQSDER